MYRRSLGPLLIAGLTGVLSGVYIFKPMVDGSMKNGYISDMSEDKVAETRSSASHSANVKGGSGPALTQK